jgi:hypothetical protein
MFNKVKKNCTLGLEQTFNQIVLKRLIAATVLDCIAQARFKEIAGNQNREDALAISLKSLIN